MKIAILNIYHGLVDRGAETFVKEISQRLAKDHEVKIFSGKRIPPGRWPHLWRFFLDPQGLVIALFTLRCLRAIWREKYKVVIPLNGGWQAGLVRLITWLYGGKVVVSGQSGMGWDDINNLWSFPNVFIALSSAAADWARKVNPFVKVIYIPNGVDLKKFKPGKRTKLVLCVGALTSQKRIDLVIRAVARTKSLKLLVVGDGGLKNKIVNLGVRLLGDRFKLMKFPYAEMPEVYRKAGVFTLPSLPSEAFGNVLVEAMAANLPVVATDDPVRREIVGEAGLFIDPTDPQQYCANLIRALETDWGNKPREQVEKFDWDKIANQFKDLIESFQ
jgi:glycosyltransferase involved in cell wall biosynthesis